ncbi:MAG: DNA polymerase III subunit delta [Gammaproteobacteria bacterium]|jgi:DNA polymerase-3 subunit delta|nr:DNA polymerase III subunit delta [Gammaproteobacteria bacterium]
MKLNAEGLSKHLQTKLCPVYLIQGDESLLVQESLDVLHEAAKQNGFLEKTSLSVDSSFKRNTLNDLTQNFSLFSEKKRVELRCGDKIPPDLMAWIQDYLAHIQQYQDLCLIITTGKLSAQQQKAKWWGALEQAGAVITIWDVDLNQYPRWLDQRLAAQKLKLTPAARQLFIEQSEGNLLAAAQIILKLSLTNQGKVIDIPDVEPLLSDHSHYGLFDLSSQVLLGNAKRSLRILNQLQHEEEAILILWALSREIKILLQIHAQKNKMPLQQLYRSFGIWDKRQPEVEQALRRLSTPILYQCLQQCAEIDLTCKGLKAGNVWFSLKQLVILMVTGREC